jgi:aconitate hydratase
MIALPFHPSNAYSIHELLENPGDILRSVEIESAKNFGDNSNELTNKVQEIIFDGSGYHRRMFWRNV